MAEHDKEKTFLQKFGKEKFGEKLMNMNNPFEGGFMPEPTAPTPAQVTQMKPGMEDLAPFGDMAEQRLNSVKDAEEDRFKKMQMLNGNTFENGERSQGDQEAEQRMVQNKATGLLQKFVGRFKDFLNRGPFPGSEDDPRTPTGSKLITGPDGKQYDENFIKTIPGGFENMQEIERRRKIFEGMP